MIPFNKPFISGNELKYIDEAVKSGHLSGNGLFTKKVHSFFENVYGFRKALLTTSCTDALEMAAILCDIGPGDEVIVPSYTFVSSALAFVRLGCKIVFADSSPLYPGIDVSKIEQLITPATKVIVPVHYAGVACNMDAIMEIAGKYNLLVVEDAAQAIDSYYKNRRLGSIGHFGTFSFHETKNIIAGEGGLLSVNDEKFVKRAEIIWEKGTNRSEFFRGEVNKYGWKDIGSSFLPSEIVSAFLWAQIENIDKIQQRRKEIWNRYIVGLKSLNNSGYIQLPFIPEYATNNAHMMYLVCRSLEERTKLISYLKQYDILAVFHYLSLSESPYITTRYGQQPALPNCGIYADRLLRLPLYYELTDNEVDFIVSKIHEFYHD